MPVPNGPSTPTTHTAPASKCSTHLHESLRANPHHYSEREIAREQEIDRMVAAGLWERESQYPLYHEGRITYHADPESLVCHAFHIRA